LKEELTTDGQILPSEKTIRKEIRAKPFGESKSIMAIMVLSVSICDCPCDLHQAPWGIWAGAFGLRHSDFFRISDFGLRILSVSISGLNGIVPLKGTAFTRTNEGSGGRNRRALIFLRLW
jgi:hypothetical protein